MLWYVCRCRSNKSEYGDKNRTHSYVRFSESNGKQIEGIINARFGKKEKRKENDGKAIESVKIDECRRMSRNKKRNMTDCDRKTGDYPRVTAARAVQVNPIAIPIHGDCPNVPSLRACNIVDLLDPNELVFVSVG